MSLLLSLDTAGSACAVALSVPGDLLSAQVLREPRIHSAKLVPMIKEIVTDAGLRMHNIDAVAVSKGPGSYTGLRIGVSTAKGLAFGLDIPLVGVATFEALAGANPHLATPLVTTAPSRRNETYWQMWRTDTEVPTALTEARSDSFGDLADRLRRIESPVTLVGEEADTLQAVLNEAGLTVGAIQPEEMRAAIYGVSKVGHRLLAGGRTEDVASFEPFYLKEFIALKGRSPFDRLPF